MSRRGEFDDGQADLVYPKLAVTVPEAAARLSLSERTVRDLLREDPGFPRIYVGRRVIIPLRALEEWANGRAQAETSATRKAVAALSSRVRT